MVYEPVYHNLLYSKLTRQLKFKKELKKFSLKKQ